MKSFLSKASVQSAAVAVGVVLSSAPVSASVAPALTGASDAGQSELAQALGLESEQFETFNRETGHFESIEADKARSMVFDRPGNTLIITDPGAANGQQNGQPDGLVGGSELEASSSTDTQAPAEVEVETEKPVCFVRFPGQDTCLVSSETALNLAKKVTSIALLKNPTGLMAYSAYRLLATDDPKTDVLLDAVAGQSVGAATAVSLGRSAGKAFEPDDSPSAREAIDALPFPLSDKEKNIGVAVIQGATGVLGVADAVSSPAGPVAGLVDLGVSAGASAAGKVLGIQPEIIKDPAVSINMSPTTVEDAMVGDVQVNDIFMRNTPTFVESGSVSLPGANKIFARDWGADHILMNAPTLRASLHNQGLELEPGLQYRDFIYESEMDGKMTYVGLGVLSSSEGGVYFEVESGPFLSREEARVGMNQVASEVLHSDPFNLLAKGFSPMDPGSFAGFGAINGRPVLDRETKLARERTLSNGDAEISFTSYTPAKGVEVVSSVYDKEVMQFMPPELSTQERHDALLNVPPKLQHTDLTPEWVNPIQPSVAQKGPAQSGLSM